MSHETYVVSSGATTFQVSFRAVSGPGPLEFTFNTRRGFLKFDLSSEGIAPGSIEAAELQLVCATVIGGGENFVLHSATGSDGWDATLDASADDYTSTVTVEEDTVAIAATGTYIWSVTPSSIDTAGTTYFRLKVETEYEEAPYFKGATFASQDNGTAANRPTLRLTLFTGQVIFVNVTYA